MPGGHSRRGPRGSKFRTFFSNDDRNDRKDIQTWPEPLAAALSLMTCHGRLAAIALLCAYGLGMALDKVSGPEHRALRTARHGRPPTPVADARADIAGSPRAGRICADRLCHVSTTVPARRNGRVRVALCQHPSRLARRTGAARRGHELPRPPARRLERGVRRTALPAGQCIRGWSAGSHRCNLDDRCTAPRDRACHQGGAGRTASSPSRSRLSGCTPSQTHARWCRGSWLALAEPQATSASSIAPGPATMTTTQGGAFHAMNDTKQASDSAKSRRSQMALVNTGE